MNQKVVIAIVAVVVVIAVIVGVFAFTSSSNQPKEELNLQELSAAISEKEPFNEMATMEIDAEALSALYDISADQYEEVVGKMPMMNVHASMYLIIKAKDGSVDTVKEKVDAYAQQQEKTWSTYLPDQYDIVKQRKQGTVGNYVYLIIAEDAAEMEKLINQ